MLFASFPLELKQSIWKFALPDDEPEVCIIWPLRPRGFAPPVEPLLVDTAFPVLMHVCQEWRNFVLNFSLSGIEFRTSKLAGCKVPYRPFRGDMDALYATQDNFELSVQCLEIEYDPGIKFSTLAKMDHLAVEWSLWPRSPYWLPELIFRGNQNLKKVSVVYPSSRKALWNMFQAPARRCKLRRIENTDKLVFEGDEFGESTRSVQALTTYGFDAAEDRMPFTFEDDMDRHEQIFGHHRTAWFTGTAWDMHTEKLSIEYEAVTFFQFQRSEDGRETWIEACEDRLFVMGEDGKLPRAPIPNEVGDPRQWRVNDDDKYVALT